MPRIRNIPGRFGRVAPGGGAVVGAGLQAAGQALGQIADVRTNMELLDIREQEQIERLEFAQFEKVERSEAIKEFTAKQIWRNQESDRLLVEAHKNRDFGDVQGQMNFLEDDFNAGVFENRSQVFQEAFESIDRSARVRNINILGTAVQRGNLGLIQENYQIAADNFVESVNASMSPAEINDFFDALDENGVNMGFTQAAIGAVSGQGRREAMERHIRSLPLVDGLAALSDEDVAKALGNKRRDILKRDLNTKKNALVANRRFVNEAFARTTSINALDAFNLGVSQSEINGMIEGQEDILPTAKKDMLDFTEALFLAKETAPRQVAPEDIKANEAFMENRMGRLVGNYNNLMSSNKDSEEVKEGLLELNSLAIAVLAESTRLNVDGGLSKEALVDLTFDMAPINEGLFVAEKQDAVGIFEKIGNVIQNGFGPQNVRIPSAIVSEELRKMTEGTGRYGGLSTEQRAVMRVLVINETVRTEGFKTAIPIEEAQKLADTVLTKAGERFVSSEFGLFGEAAEQVKGLIFNSGVPATEPRQQPDISPIADSIRDSLSRGRTIGEIEEFARTRPQFSQGAFDKALATVAPAEVESLGLSAGKDRRQFALAETIRTSDSGLDFIREREGFAGVAAIVLNENEATGGFGHKGGFEVGEEVTKERAEELLRQDVAEAEGAVETIIPNSERLSEGEFDAVVSLVFSVGQGAFAASKAAKALNEALSGDARDEGAIKRFLFEAFDSKKGFVRAKGKVIRGLVNRRAAERRLFQGAG